MQCGKYVPQVHAVWKVRAQLMQCVKYLQRAKYVLHLFCKVEQKAARFFKVFTEQKSVAQINNMHCSKL